MIKISNFKSQILNSRRGFTFIELILYISILTIMLSAIIPFAWDVIGSGRKSATQQEVNSQARYISERIKYEIRNATNVNVLGNNIIIFSTSIPSTNPTYIAKSVNNDLSIIQGSGNPWVKLHSANTTISKWFVSNFSSSDGKTKNIQFKFTVNSAFGSQNQMYKASSSIQSSAEVRSN